MQGIHIINLGILFVMLLFGILAVLWSMVYVNKKKRNKVANSNRKFRKKTQQTEEDMIMKNMLESINYNNNSLEFDINPDNILQLKAGKKVLEDILKAGIKVFDKKDVYDMLTKIDCLIKEKENNISPALRK